MSRHDLTDREFSAIRYLLPSRGKPRHGRSWSHHRTVINGILWILYTGSPWRDLPSEFGKWQTVDNRFRRWIDEAVWAKIFSVPGHRRRLAKGLPENSSALLQIRVNLGNPMRSLAPAS